LAVLWLADPLDLSRQGGGLGKALLAFELQ
jgi:hypothetical protein